MTRYASAARVGLSPSSIIRNPIQCRSSHAYQYSRDTPTAQFSTYVRATYDAASSGKRKTLLRLHPDSVFQSGLCTKPYRVIVFLTDAMRLTIASGGRGVT